MADCLEISVFFLKNKGDFKIPAEQLYYMEYQANAIMWTAMLIPCW